MEAAIVELDLVPIFLVEGALNADAGRDLELIIADEDAARLIRSSIAIHRSHHKEIATALIAVKRERSKARSSYEPDAAFDGRLQLPQRPRQLALQLGVMLYAHRAYLRRYHSAVEELELNRRIFRSLTGGVSISDAMQPDLPLTYVNPAFEAMTGYSLEEVRGRNCRFLQDKDRQQAGVVAIRGALKAGTETTVIVRNYRKDGLQFWNEVTISPIRNQANVITHYVGMQNDVTLRMEYESQLRESEKLAVVGKFASSVAHEVNNPLESVMNLVFLAQATESQAETKAYLEQVDRELQRVRLITSRSLRFYKQLTDARSTECNALIDSIVELNESRIVNKQISIERRNRVTSPLVCKESEVRQVFNNLVGNAIDAIQPGGGRLALRTREFRSTKSGTRGVLVTVADTGVGMSSDMMRKLYRAFFTTKGIAGTGLGLWISHEIVSRHRGWLRVRSRESVGTVFHCFLPYSI